MPNPPKGTTGSKLPQNKDTRKLTPKEWIAYNESIGNIRVPSQAVYPSFKDPNKSYEIPGDPNDHLPYITYTSDWPPKPVPLNNTQPVQLGPNTNYNPNTGQYFNPVTQTEIQPIIEQYFKGGKVKGYAYGSGPYGVQPQVSGYTSPYTQQNQRPVEEKKNNGMNSMQKITALNLAGQGLGSINPQDTDMKYGSNAYFDQRNQQMQTGQGIASAAGAIPIVGAFKSIGEGAQSAIAPKDAYGVSDSSNAAIAAGGFLNPLESTTSAWNDIKSGNIDKKTWANLLLPGVGQVMQNKENKAEREKLIQKDLQSQADQQKADRKLTEDSIVAEKMALRDMGITGLKDEYIADPTSDIPQEFLNTATSGMDKVYNIYDQTKGGNKHEKTANFALNAIKQVNPFKRKANGGKVGYNMGGDIKGHGGPKDDAIDAEIEQGAFIVPNENMMLAKIIRSELFPGTENQQASLKDKKSTAVPVRLSNMEHKFTKEEKDEIVSELGEEMLEMLAPNAEDESEEMREGGLTQAKARKILHDGTIRGKSITDKQRKYFGAIASGEFKCGGMIKGYKNGGAVPEYANGTGKDGVDPEFTKKELAKLEAQRKADAKRMGEQQAQLKYDEAVRNLRAQIYKNLERQNADKKKYKSELDKYTAEYNAVKKSYDDYVKESDFELNRPESPSRAYIGTSDKPSAESVRKEREKLLKMLQEKESKLNEAKKNYDFASNESNYIKTGSKQKSTDVPSDFTPFSKGMQNAMGGSDLDAAKRLESDVKSTPVKTGTKKSTAPKIDPYIEWTNSMRPGLYGDNPNEPQNAEESIAAMNQQRQPQAPAQQPYTGVDPNLALYDRDMAERLAELEANPQNQPQYDVQPQPRNYNMNDILGGLVNYGIPALQVGMGLRNLKKAGDRPVDRLDPDFLRSVSRSAGTAAEAKARSEYGLDPATLAYLNQQNQLATRQAMGAARNYSGGSAANALSLSGAALGDQYGRTLQTKVADAQAKEAKYGDYLNAQRYNDALTSQKADMNRRLFTDNLNAWNQNQQAGSELVGAGFRNMIGASRFEQEKRRQAERDALRNNIYY